MNESIERGVHTGCCGAAPCSALLDALEDMARQHCFTQTQPTSEQPGLTDSQALTANATALEVLAENKRFRIIRGYGRMICGYWPENEPNDQAQAQPPGKVLERKK